MNVSNENDKSTIKCYKCDKRMIQKLNIIYNGSTGTIILWNEFQIFVYENLEFKCALLVIIPDFQIYNIITTNNYILCLDVTGNIHTLKLKSSGQKRIKYDFQPRLPGVKACTLYNEGYVLCLKYENIAFCLNAYKLNKEFSLKKMAIVLSSNDTLPDEALDKYILKSYPISKHHMKKVKNIFKIKKSNLNYNYHLVVLSFDGLTLYGCLFSTEMVEETANLVKLYTCPSAISNIDFIEIDNSLKILVALSMGTLICLNLEEEKTIQENEEELKKAQIIHLNISLYKFLVYDQSILYTNGNKMYKADNFLSSNINVSEIFVKNVKDFVKFGDQIICTTFNNTIYIFTIGPSIPQDSPEYYPAETVVNNTKTIKEILSEVERNETLIKKHILEKNYITAMSLSNRQDIMDNVIKHKSVVYKRYEDAIKESTNVHLTSKLKNYFERKSFKFLLNVSTTSDHKLHDILSSSVGDLNIHVTFIPADRLARTSTIKVKEVLKNMNILIPMPKSYICTTNMKVEVKIMTSLPGAYDSSNNIWAVLYRKSIRLNADNFIKFNLEPQKVRCLKEPKETVEEVVLRLVRHEHGHLCEISRFIPEPKSWNMYVRLPAEYKELCKESRILKCWPRRVHYFMDKFTSEDFLNSITEICLPIDDDNLVIKIDNDGFSTPTLKISSNNLRVAMHIKNFLSDLLYEGLSNFEEGKEFIPNSFYTTLSDFRSNLRSYMSTTSEDIHSLSEQFEKKIIGVLPV